MNYNQEKIVEVTRLTKTYGEFKALVDVNFDVYKGDVFGFLGPNGAGKSTTIRCILSLITATSGEIKIFGKNIISQKENVFSNIGCIVERPDFYKYLSAEKNLEIFARISGKVISKKKILETLEFVGLTGRQKDKISGFSNGMKQRLGIALTLLHDPELIILDEPTTGLDPQGIIDVRNLILQLSKEQNKTIILSSHQLSEIELIANRMVIIDKGKTIVQGVVDELLNEQDLIVSFKVNDIDRAKQILEHNFYKIIELKGSENSIYLQISQDKIPIVNKLLCDNAIDVFLIETKRKLEDYFLKLIHN